jgi:hypothetical protein
MSVNYNELRNFGILLGAIFTFIIGLLLPLAFHRAWQIWPFIVGSVLILLAVLLPKRLKYVYLAWMYLGAVLGWINTRILLLVFFLVVLTPIALIKKIFGKDSLNRNWDKSVTTYRKLPEFGKEQSMERTF